jgi:hypothetical protein
LYLAKPFKINEFMDALDTALHYAVTTDNKESATRIF